MKQEVAATTPAPVRQEGTGARGLWQSVAFETYGVRVRVGMAGEGLPAEVHRLLPPVWSPLDGARGTFHVRVTLRVLPDGRVAWHVRQPHLHAHDVEPLAAALASVESALHFALACSARTYLFVHAGVVAWNGRAILLPGRSGTGKTTLAASLVAAGARYYSDEFAVLDDTGLVYPYARSLVMRQGKYEAGRYAAEDLGGCVGVDPLPVGVIVSTRYVPGGRWQPQPLTAAQAVLRLLDNTVLARELPEKALLASTAAAARAVAVEGTRGDADEVVRGLITTV